MSRSIWKGPFSLLKKVSLSQPAQSSKPNVWCRQSMILPQDVGKEFKIYNGKGWALRQVIESMVGHKFGEFSSTKKRVIHKMNKKRQTSRKK